MHSDARTFVLGLGAQKAGTSWLHQYLDSDPSADFGTLKEYHIWDALELPDAAHFDVRPGKTVNRALMGLAARIKGKDLSPMRLRGALQEDPDRYFDYFTDILDRPGITLTGDITPSYAALPPQTLEKLLDGFQARGITAKVVFIMRDPIARAVSAAQMNRRKRDWREGVPLLGAFDAAVLRYAQSSKHDLRANYARTISHIREVFAPEDIHIYVYEALFDPDIVERLSSTFGVSFRPEKISSRVYAKTSDQDVSDQTKTALYNMLEETYRFCAREFPETRTLWHAL